MPAPNIKWDLYKRSRKFNNFLQSLNLHIIPAQVWHKLVYVKRRYPVQYTIQSPLMTWLLLQLVHMPEPNDAHCTNENLLTYFLV